ncbi:hypothetical protein [Micromonospora sp. NPDC047074]|uniref:hypothetical protein n=1 Tax=Micromonospora sp. NPDC047074 TaxID=3154339 RepID=UPI0033E0E53C
MNSLAEEAKQYGDTERALASARRRRSLRRVAVSASATVAVASVVLGLSAGLPDTEVTATASKPPPSSPVAEQFPGACVAARLPLPAGYRYGAVSAGDPTGRFMAGQLDPGDDSRRRPVFWADGRIQLPSPPGLDPGFTDINSRGAAVGTSTVRDTKGQLVTTAWYFHNGKFTTLKGERAAASAINEQGVIVGTVNMAPARWRDVGAEPEILSLPPGVADLLEVHGIDEDGSMLGIPRVLWHPDGTPGRLPAGFAGLDIRHRWVSGSASRSGARLDLRTGRVEILDGQLQGVSSLISANGWVAGQAKDGTFRLATPSRHLDLAPPDRDMPAHGRLAFISDDGRTIGGVFGEEEKAGDGYRAISVVWRCS